MGSTINAVASRGVTVVTGISVCISVGVIMVRVDHRSVDEEEDSRINNIMISSGLFSVCGLHDTCGRCSPGASAGGGPCPPIAHAAVHDDFLGVGLPESPWPYEPTWPADLQNACVDDDAATPI